MLRLISASIVGAALLGMAGLTLAQEEHGPPPPVVSITTASPEIPFELFRGNRILIPVTINGHRTIAMLDSAASTTTVDQAYAKSIGLPPGLKIVGHGTGGDVEAELVSGLTLDAGNLAFRDMSVGVMDLSSVARAVGHPITVVLGREFFSSAVVSIDWASSRLHLGRSNDFSPPAGAEVVTLGELGPFRTIPVSVNDGPPINALFDIGASGNLALAAKDWSKIPAVAALPYAEGRAGGVGGLHPMRSVTFPSVTYGGRRFVDVPGDLDDETDVKLATRMTNAGIGFLKQFRVDLDFGHERLYLRPRDDAPPFDRDRSGTRLELSDRGLNVLYVSPQGPAAKAGLKAGDEIVAIDGRQVTKDYYATADWTREAAGTTVELTKADGSKVDVTLADYF